MTTPAETFRRDHPDLFFLDPGDPGALEAYLHDRGVLHTKTRVLQAAKAGDGNMNCTVRALTTEGSMIVKQARPWVEKYPQFAAPWDRTAREAAFYRAISSIGILAGMTPGLLHFDPDSRVIVLEDLGASSDCTAVYAGQPLDDAEIVAMANFLSRLHSVPSGLSERNNLTNREMRQLNHAHIFVVPLDTDNGLDLDAITPGLADAARSLQADSSYVQEVRRLGREVYLADGECLLHGDFFPGSLLRTTAGPKVIDPEFAFYGRPEFDVGVFLAHLILSKHPSHTRRLWRRAYVAPVPFDDLLMLQLAGVEIMRRLIGYAQLPIQGGERKARLLERSRELVLRPDPSWLQAGRDGLL